MIRPISEGDAWVTNNDGDIIGIQLHGRSETVDLSNPVNGKVDPVTGMVSYSQENSTYAHIGAGIQSTVRKLADTGATGDVTVLVIGDSTAGDSMFGDVLMPLVQAFYPHRSLRRYAWDNTGKAYTAPVTTVAGSGATFINHYAGGVGGTVFESSLGAQFDAQIAAIQPDLVIIHSGHNYGATAASSGQPNDATMDRVHLERSKRFVLRVMESCPNADILLNSQNPYLTAGTRDGISAVRAQAYRRIAADLGCAYGPIYEAFLATGTPSAYLQADLLHPSITGDYNGALLSAKALLPQFKVSANIPVQTKAPSPLLVPGRQLLTNADFALFASPPTLTNWTALNAVLTKESTIYEGKNGYSVKIAGNAAAYNKIYQSLPMKLVKGQVITCAARVYRPAASSNEAGRVSVSGDGGLVTTTSGTLALVPDQWVWVFVTVRVPNGATYATFSINGGASATDICYVDRASVVVGTYPRDVS